MDGSTQPAEPGNQYTVNGQHATQGAWSRLYLESVLGWIVSLGPDMSGLGLNGVDAR